jgi:DNA-binding transcriptional ArsR family regulator
VLDDPEQVTALAHPLRVALLDALREPDSAAGAARRIGESRQKVNHHVKALLDVGLVRLVGERRSGNFVEQLYQAVARRFVVSSAFAWTRERLVRALRDQASLSKLLDLGERLQRDATALLDRAAAQGDEVPSATAEAELGFASAAERARFLNEYLAAIGPLLERYGSRRGERYRVALAVYPEPGSDHEPDPTKETP